jgi:hypothetical protein
MTSTDQRRWAAEILVAPPGTSYAMRPLPATVETIPADLTLADDTERSTLAEALTQAVEWADLGFEVRINLSRTTITHGTEDWKGYSVNPSRRGRTRWVARYEGRTY